MQKLRVNNSRILKIKNAKFSGHYFYMNLNIYGDFQICISVPNYFGMITRKWMITWKTVMIQIYNEFGMHGFYYRKK